MAREEEIGTVKSSSSLQSIQQESDYCEVCGIDVLADKKLKRFDKLFCSDEHLNQYLHARQKKLGIIDDIDGKTADDMNGVYQQEGQEYPRRSGWFRRLSRGCC